MEEDAAPAGGAKRRRRDWRGRRRTAGGGCQSGRVGRWAGMQTDAAAQVKCSGACRRSGGGHEVGRVAESGDEDSGRQRWARRSGTTTGPPHPHGARPRPHPASSSPAPSPRHPHHPHQRRLQQPPAAASQPAPQRSATGPGITDHTLNAPSVQRAIRAGAVADTDILTSTHPSVSRVRPRVWAHNA